MPARSSKAVPQTFSLHAVTRTKHGRDSSGTPASVDPPHPALGRLPWPFVAVIRLSRWKFDLHGVQVLVRDLAQKMRDAVQSCALLVVGVDDKPGRFFTVGVPQHHVLCSRIFDPVLACLQVHWAELPALDRVTHALDKTTLLLFVVYREPVLDEIDARAHEHLLKKRARPQKFLVFLIAAKTHYPLDARAVVPAAVEQDDLSRGGQLLDIALKVPLASFTLGGGAQGDNAANAWVQAFGNAPYHTTLAGSIATFEQDTDLEPLQPHPLLHFEQFKLQPNELIDVAVIPVWRNQRYCVADDPPTTLGGRPLFRIDADFPVSRRFRPG